MKLFYTRSPDALDRYGLTLSARVHHGALQIQSEMPGARDPSPHQMINLTLPQESLLDLVAIVLEGAK